MAEEDLTAIKNRNARVEADKAWETSWTRRILIACGTYIIGFLYLSLIGVSPAALHAAVPSGAYLISTLTLPLLKSLWISNIYRK